MASALAELELQQQGSLAEIRSAQRISMSLASRNPTKNLLCQPPTVQSIPYYHKSGANPHLLESGTRIIKQADYTTNLLPLLSSHTERNRDTCL